MGLISRKMSLHVVWCQIEWAVWPDLQLYYTKAQKKNLHVTTDKKLSFDEHINNIYKIANKKLNVLSRINHSMKQNQKELLLSSFIMSHLSYCPLTWIFYSWKFTKKINALYERSLQIILNDYKYSHSLLEEVIDMAHQIMFHQRCINSLMIEPYNC